MDMWEHLDAHRGRFLAKIDTYPPAHHRHLARYQDARVTFLEIGVFAGGSLEVWRSYLGPDARVAGIDINPACKALEADGFEVFIGDQADPGFLREVAAELGTIDVVSDDGGHRAHQQITSFETLWPCLADDGVYMVEDTSSSYLASWGPARGGGAHPGSFIDFARARVDDLHVWYTDAEPSPLARSLVSVAFYGGLVIFEKGRVERPGWVGSAGEGLRRVPLDLDQLAP